MAIDYSALGGSSGNVDLGQAWQGINTGLANIASSFPTPAESYSKKQNAYLGGMSHQVTGNFSLTGNDYSWQNAATGNTFNMLSGDTAWNDYQNVLKEDRNYGQWDRRGLIDPLQFNQQYAQASQGYSASMLGKILQMASDPNVDSESLKRTFDKAGMSAYVGQSIIPLLNTEMAMGYGADAVDKVKGAISGASGEKKFGGMAKMWGGEGKGYGVGPFEYAPYTSGAAAVGAAYGARKIYSKYKEGGFGKGVDTKGAAKGAGKGKAKTKGGAGKGGGRLKKVKDFMTKKRIFPKSTPGTYDKTSKIARGEVSDAPRRGRPPLPAREKYTSKLRRQARNLLGKGAAGKDLTPNQTRALEGNPIKGRTPKTKITSKSKTKTTKSILNKTKKLFKNQNVGPNWDKILKTKITGKDFKNILKGGIKGTVGYTVTSAGVDKLLETAGAGDKTRAVTNEAIQIASKTGVINTIYSKVSKHGASKILKKVAQVGGYKLAARTLGKGVIGLVGGGATGGLLTGAMWAWSAYDLYEIYKIINDMP